MNKYLLLLITTIIATGCIKENRSNCNYDISLLLSYVVEVEGDNLFDQNLDSITVHMFNEDDKYIFTKKENASTIINNGYIMTIPMEEPGTYKAVVIGDTDQKDYTVGSVATPTHTTKALIPNETDLEDFRISVKHTNGLIDRELGDFFIAISKEVIVTGLESQIVEVMLTKNTKKIHLTINGLGNSSDLTPTIRCKNGTYNSENTIPDNSEEITYKPYTPTATTRANSVFTLSTLRLIEGMPMPLSLESVHGEIPVRDLMELIKLNPKYKTQEDIDAEDEFNLTLNYGTDGTILISVTVNNWEHVWVTPEA